MSDITWEVEGVIVDLRSPDHSKVEAVYVCPGNARHNGKINLGPCSTPPLIGQRILVTVAWADTPLGIPGGNP